MIRMTVAPHIEVGRVAKRPATLETRMLERVALPVPPRSKSGRRLTPPLHAAGLPRQGEGAGPDAALMALGFCLMGLVAMATVARPINSPTARYHRGVHFDAGIRPTYRDDAAIPVPINLSASRRA